MFVVRNFQFFSHFGEKNIFVWSDLVIKQRDVKHVLVPRSISIVVCFLYLDGRGWGLDYLVLFCVYIIQSGCWPGCLKKQIIKRQNPELITKIWCTEDLSTLCSCLCDQCSTHVSCGHQTSAPIRGARVCGRKQC